LNRSSVVRTLLASAALVAAVALAGCNTDGTMPTNSKAMKPLSDKMMSEIEQKNMDKDSPILVRLFKQESELEIWKQDRSGRFALLKTYPICRWSGELGPKIREGDRQAPEGFYTITPGQMNPNSQYYLSFDLGYPNAYDRAHGRTGAHLMVHGDCSSRGCYSMTDEQISEIYALGREAFFGGQRSFQVQAYPFRMTAQNMAKHRANPNMPFWKMLKQGNDHFEVSRIEPKVDVCEKRYVFNALAADDPSRPLSFSPTNRCPVYEVPQDIASAVQDKQRKDEYQTAELITRGTPVAPIKTGADGGMHPVFAAALQRGTGAAPTAYTLASVPGTIPANVRPPRTPEFEDHYVTASTPASGVRMASTDPEGSVQQIRQPQPAQTSSGGNLFGNLFSSGSKPAPAAAPAKKDAGAKEGAKQDGPLDRMAKFMGLRGSDPAPAQAEAPPAPKPRPAARTQTANHGAIRPVAAATAPAPAPEPVRTAQTQPAAAPVSAPIGTMSGAAAPVPAGSFDSRWQAFR
jgi:murein L,D-transpeptidase YafK